VSLFVIGEKSLDVLRQKMREKGYLRDANEKESE
jgi:hypothetical protein